MTERGDARDRLHLAVVASVVDHETRLCAFAMLNHYVEMHRAISDHLGLAPVEMLILLATTTGNVQRVARPETLPAELRGSTPLPDDLIVPISRRAIARITGIPKETVRRHVDHMVRRGLLLSTPKGLRARPGLGGAEVRAAVRRLVEQHVACTELLVRLGAVELRRTQPSRTRRA